MTRIEGTGVNQLSTRITLTEGGKHGASFELNPIEHDYEIKFAQHIAKLAIRSRKPIHMVDFGCGDGSKTVGMIQVVAGAGYEKPLIYSGIDINPQGIEAARGELGEVSHTVIESLRIMDLRDTNQVGEWLRSDIRDSQLNVFLFSDSLQWLQPGEIHSLLKLAYDRATLGTQLLAAVTSVWSRRAIGKPGDPQQAERIKQIERCIKENKDVLVEVPDQIVPGGTMTHFTDQSLRHVFESVGFHVTDSRWWDNSFYPNGVENLSENVLLTAYK